MRLGRFATYQMDQNVSPQPPSGSVTLLEPEGTAPDQKVTPMVTLVSGDQLQTACRGDVADRVLRLSVTASHSPMAGASQGDNDLHNAGELSTNTFRQLNTQLLSVIEGPLDE